MVEKCDTTVGEIYLWVRTNLKNSGITGYEYESRLILSRVLECEDVFIFTHAGDPVDCDKIDLITEYTKKRIKGMPLQYITGTSYFMGLSFGVNEHVLIPRPDTEILVQKAVEIMESNGYTKVLDIGTGSGCIAISISFYKKDSLVDALDINENALDLAKKNSIIHCVSDRIEFIHSDIYGSLYKEPKFSGYQVIVSNPPYIKTDEYNTLQDEVRLYEPASALLAGDDGLLFYDRICKDAHKFLVDDGYLLFETGYKQAGSVCEIMRKYGFSDICVTKDFSGIDRVVFGRNGC